MSIRLKTTKDTRSVKYTIHFTLCYKNNFALMDILQKCQSKYGMTPFEILTKLKKPKAKFEQAD